MVYYNLRESPFSLWRGRYHFYFSSQFNLSRFEEREDIYQEKIEESLTKRFGISVEAMELSRFLLYRKIEKRGFAVRTGNGWLEWPLLDGQKDNKNVSVKPLASTTQNSQEN